MLSQRIGFGALMIAALVGLIWLDSCCAGRGDVAAWARLIDAGPVVSLLWMVVSVFAARELCALFRHGGFRPASDWSMLCTACLALCPLVGKTAECCPNADLQITLMLVIVAVAGSFVSVANARRTAPRPDSAPVDLSGAGTDLAITVFVIIYVGLLGAFIPRLRIAAATPWVLLYALLVIKSADIGAYFTGMAIGRHKLIPWLSPKKTIEGLFGGMMLAAITATLLPHAMSTVAHLLHGLPPWQLALFGMSMAIVGQTGDLLESLIKRGAGSKDSGAVVPAFGGLLDILDSPLLCMPVVYYLLLASGR